MSNPAGIDTTGTNADSYTGGNCTWYVAAKEPWIPAGLGDAYQWFSNAIAKGLQTSHVPILGSVVVYGKGNGYSQFGHVAIVTDVSNFRGTGGTFGVTEMNFTSLWAIGNSRQSTMQDVEGFILPPGSSGPKDLGNLGQDAVQAAVNAALAPIGQQLQQSTSSLLTTVLYGFEVLVGGALVIATVAIMILTAFNSKQGGQVRRTAMSLFPKRIKGRLKTAADKTANRPAGRAEKPATAPKPTRTPAKRTPTIPKPRRRRVSVMGTRKEQRARMFAQLKRNEERLRQEHANYDYSQIPF